MFLEHVRLPEILSWSSGEGVAALTVVAAHHNSQARGDILVRTTDLEITDRVQGQGCSRNQFIIDVKTSHLWQWLNGPWWERWNGQTNQHYNPVLCWLQNK
jgi:hypothetical protein